MKLSKGHLAGTRRQIVFLSFCVIIALISIQGCKDKVADTGPSPALNLNSFGIPGQTKKYYKTVSEFIEGTTTPSIVPADSIKLEISYPDSLYKNGIFCYFFITEQYESKNDTIIVEQNGEGYNLFFEINSLYAHYITDGKAYDANRIKYYSVQNKINSISENGIFPISVDIPLFVGKQYTSQDGRFNFTVSGEEVVTTPAGQFNTFKILQVNSLFGGLGTQVFYINPQFGIIRRIITFGKSPLDLPWDTSKTLMVQQVHSYELISIN